LQCLLFFVKVLDTGAITEDVLEVYLNKMAKRGEWGDGIMLSAAVRLYERPIIILTPDGQIQTVDTRCATSAEPIRLGLINNNHYLRICKIALEKETTQECSDNAHIKQSSKSELDCSNADLQTMADEPNKESVDMNTEQAAKKPSDGNKISKVTIFKKYRHAEYVNYFLRFTGLKCL
jgi:hypothetical protein